MASPLRSTFPDTPEIQAILQDPSASFWLKDNLRVQLSRAPVNALKDAEKMVELLRGHVDMILRQERPPWRTLGEGGG